MKSKVIIMVLSFLILFLSVGMYVESADPAEIVEKCKTYCKKYTGYLYVVCFDGCIEGAMQ